MARHNLYGVQIDGTVVGSITENNIRTGSEVRGEAVSGEPYPRKQSLTAQKPTATFTSLSIATALANCGPMGASITAMAAGLNFYAQKRLHGGSRTTGSAHRKFALVDGLLLPRSLTCDHQGDAQIGYEAVVTWDAVNDPFQITDSVALPGGLLDDDRYTLGPVTIGGVTLGEKINVNIDFGISAESEGADSNIWDTEVSIGVVAPRITLSGKDIEWFKAANIPLLGKAATHANTSIQFYKRSGSTLVAGVTLTADGWAVVEEPFSASGQGTADTQIVLAAEYDGSNDPLVVS